MATTTRYVNTASVSAGGNGTTNGTTGPNRAYASLNEWESNEQTTISAGDIHEVLCDGSTIDGTATVISGWTVTGELHIIQNNSGYDGTAASGYHIEDNGSGVSVIQIDEANVTIDGLEITFPDEGSVYSSYGGRCIDLIGGSSALTVKNCLMHTTDNSHLTAGIGIDDTAGFGADVTCENNVYYGFALAGVYQKDTNAAYESNTWTITNDTYYNCGWDSAYDSSAYGGIAMEVAGDSTVTVVVNNSLIHASGGTPCNDNALGGVFSGDWNITDDTDTTVPGANSQTNTTFTTSTGAAAVILANLTDTTEDFNLTDHANNDALDFSSDAATSTSTDIIGTDRSTVPDCGAFQTSTGGAPSATYPGYYSSRGGWF